MEVKLADVNVEFVSFGRPVLSFPEAKRAIVEGKVQIEQLWHPITENQQKWSNVYYPSDLWLGVMNHSAL